MDYKKAAIELAEALVAADQNKRCDLCNKEEWGSEHHEEGCPHQLAAQILCPEPERDGKIRELAKARLASEGQVEFDENAVVSEGDDNGAYVQAWVWVDFAGTELDKGTDEEEE